MRIGLVDVDSHNFPNLPLMKISAWHKQQGDTVEWWDPNGGQYTKVYASKVFTESPLPVIHNADEVQIGGSGVDLENKLPYEIEHSTPDYSLYPQFDFALGWLTRGCPRKNHGFCITPKKDGCRAIKTADLNEFWTGQKQIYLLDQNLLACKDRTALIRQLAASGATVEFGGGMDVRFMTDEVIEELRHVKVKDFHFAWDDPREDLFPQFLKAAASGLFPAKKTGVYVLTNYWSTHEEDLARLYKLRILGYCPYVMIYDKQKFVTEKGRLLPDVWERYSPDEIYHFKLCQHLQRWTTNRALWATCPTIESYQPYTNFIAINHDPEAIRIHKANHPHTMHLTEDIFTVDLQKYVAGRKVDLMWASPDCTSHSKAKGGQPRHQGLRILPWAVYKHAKAILPEIIIMENVEEIQQWGPLDGTGRPIKERAGEDYNNFIQAMCSLGYTFDSRELVAADYGAPTTRKRWYAIFRRDQRPITWPVATHSKDGGHGTQKWLSCGDFIDWSDLGKSIFSRPKPLAEATMRRIANGYRKYVVENPTPYIVNNKEAVAFLIQYHGETKAGDARGQLLTEPIKTIDTSNRYGLVTAFITKFYKTGTGQSCREPLHTITTSTGHFGLVSAFLIKYYGTGCGQTLEEPLATITTKDRFGLVNVVVELDGEKYILKDIFLRMLKAEPELKLMQGFPADYIITHDYDGKPYPIKEQVARIGNSVVPIMAKALVQANCPHLIKEAMTA